MCGIAGFVTKRHASSPDELTQRCDRMTEAIKRRGPDSHGAWVDETSGVGLGHRRLAIIDLSPAGHQPMASACQRFMISFNGEIYNFPDIKSELAKAGKLPPLRGSSDTEVLLAAISAWGVLVATRKINGMFAFALWDRELRTLWLARDRMGKKPLYYGRTAGGDLVFASELKAIRAYPGFDNAIDRNALGLFMQYGFVPAPHSIYEGIGKLGPGQIAAIAPDGTESRTVYWSPREAAIKGMASRFAASDGVRATAELKDLLIDAVRIRMMSDVPLGAFLSGGIDSSLVVSLMQSLASRPVNTFSIGFSEEGYNEAEHAKAVAKHLGTNHTELYVSPRESLDVIPLLPTMYDEPFADSSQIPSYLVAKMARRDVTVALSGDGGDEVFAGYNRYLLGKRLWGTLSKYPSPLRQAAAGVMSSVPPRTWDSMYGLVEKALPPRLRFAQAGDKMHKLAGTLAAPSFLALYHRLISFWREPSEIVMGAEPGLTLDFGDAATAFGQDEVDLMTLLDMQHYLPDDILAKVDRATMAVSLEGRSPLLDYRVVEFGWRLPTSLKIKDRKGKQPLRDILYQYVPREIMDRPKMGFAIPLADWLRGPLRPWAEALLAPKRLAQDGFLHPAPISRKWDEHMSGSRNWQYYLWNVLMFQAWLENERSGFAS